ncbi:MAG: peptide transporter [Oscillospiraceae bacterium]|nr:peptide transporter [Oscillospiraceae bacterium]
MKNMIKLTDHTSDDIFEIFRIADELIDGKHSDILKGKSVILFFPESSIRTRVTFEKGIHLLGGQPILFPTEALDKKEAIEDVCGYLNNWADMVIARHKDISLLEKMSRYLSVPLINAMTSENHPCEVLSDLYSLSKMREDFLKLKYLFCGANGNIGLAWKEAAEVLGFELEQCCPNGYEMRNISVHHDLTQAIKGKDVICTDSLPSAALADFVPLQITESAMRQANKNALLNPCPPFFRGEEVSADAIDSEFFVGYEFKKNLLIVQQAIMIYCLTH